MEKLPELETVCRNTVAKARRRVSRLLFQRF